MGKCFSKDESKGSKAVVPGKRATSPHITVREVREVRKDPAVAEKPRVETNVAGNGRKLDASLVEKPAELDSLVEVPVLRDTAGLSEKSLDRNESRAATQQVGDVQDLRQVSEDVAVLDKDEGAESKVEEVSSEVDSGLPASLDLGVGVVNTPVAELASPPEVVAPEARVHVRRPSMSSTEFAGHFAEFEDSEAKAVVMTAVPALAEKSLPAPYESAELKGEATSAVAVKTKPEGAKLMKAGRPALKDISVNATPKREQAVKRQPPKSPVLQSMEAFPVPGAQTRPFPSEIKRSRSAKRSRDWTVLPDDACCSGGWTDKDKHAKLVPADDASTVAAITSNADIASAGPESQSCACASLENPEPLLSEGENSTSSTLAGTNASIGTTFSPRTPTFGEGWLITSLLLDQDKGNKLESKDVGPPEFPSLDSLGPDVAVVAEGSLGTGKAHLDQEEIAEEAGTAVEVTSSPSDLAVVRVLQAEEMKSKSSSTSPTEVVPANVESSCNSETSSLVMPSVASGTDVVSERKEPHPNGHSDLVGIPLSESLVEGGEFHNTSAAINLQTGGGVVSTAVEGVRTGDLDCKSQEETEVVQGFPGSAGVVPQNEQVGDELETGDLVVDPRSSTVSKDELVAVVTVESAEEQLDSWLALPTSRVGLDEGMLSGSSDVRMQSSVVNQEAVQERDNPEALPQGETQSGKAATMADLPLWVEVEVTLPETAGSSALTEGFDAEEAVEVLVSTDSSAGLVSAYGKTGAEDTHEVIIPNHESRSFQGVGNSEEHSSTKSPGLSNAGGIVSEGTHYYSKAAPSARVDTSASGVCLEAFGSPFKPSVDAMSSEPRNSSQVSGHDSHDVQPPVNDASDGLIPEVPEQPLATTSTCGKAPSISSQNVVANQSPSVSNKGPSTTASDNFLVKPAASKKTGTFPAIPRPPRPSKVTDSQLSEAISTLSEKPLRLSSSAPSSPQSAIFDLSQYSLPSTPGDSNARRSSVDSRGSEGPIFDLSQFSLPSTPLSMSNRSTPMSQPSTPMRIGHANAIALTAEEIAEIWGAFEQGTRASSPAPV